MTDEDEIRDYYYAKRVEITYDFTHEKWAVLTYDDQGATVECTFFRQRENAIHFLRAVSGEYLR